MSRKSTEGGRLYNRKLIQVFKNCLIILKRPRKTYCMIKRLINKKQ